MTDQTVFLQQAVQQAVLAKTPLQIVGGNSKAFYGRPAVGQTLAVGGHQGIINYHPSELVITARAGTSLATIQASLAEHGQMLAFEPPHFSATATLAGIMACALSGSRRPFTGSARDFMLGCTLINGKAEVLRFGGEVMKNVAGYDVSRLMVGAMGTLGVLLSVSLKVLPLPASEMTVCMALNPSAAISKMLALSAQSLPLSALAYDGQLLHIRLSGAATAVHSAAHKIGGDQQVQGQQFWQEVNEQQHSFFQTSQNIWRIAVPPATPELALAGEWFNDWGGGLRWLRSDEPAQRVFALAELAQGHAALFRSADRTGEVFQPLSGKLQQLHRHLKLAFDPEGIFNPHRLYQDW